MSNERAMPNAALRVLLDALVEVMGENGLKAVLNAANWVTTSLPPEKRFGNELDLFRIWGYTGCRRRFLWATRGAGYVTTDWTGYVSLWSKRPTGYSRLGWRRIEGTPGENSHEANSGANG